LPDHTMTPEQHREHAERIVRSHALDVEMLAIWEMCEDAEPTDDDANAIAALCRTAQITVTWPSEESADA
jgi:hypothetical protein